MIRPCAVSTRNIRPGWRRPFAIDVAGRDVEHARLGRHHDPAVARDPVAAGAEPVAVERGADPDAVGERERRRPVPRLHQARVVLVERPALGRHRACSGPTARGPSSSSRGRGSGPTGGAAPARCRRSWVSEPSTSTAGRTFCEVVAEHRGPERRLAGEDPVHVPAQRVDLAVVADVAVRVRPGPATGRCWSRTAQWTRASGALEAPVVEVRVERQQLGRVEHPLVDDRATAHRRDVEVVPAGERGAADGLLDQAPRDVQATVEGEVPVRAGAEAVGPGDERLLDDGLAGPRGVAEAAPGRWGRGASRGA